MEIYDKNMWIWGPFWMCLITWLVIFTGYCAHWVVPEQLGPSKVSIVQDDPNSDDDLLLLNQTLLSRQWLTPCPGINMPGVP